MQNADVGFPPPLTPPHKGEGKLRARSARRASSTQPAPASAALPAPCTRVISWRPCSQASSPTSARSSRADGGRFTDPLGYAGRRHRARRLDRLRRRLPDRHRASSPTAPAAASPSTSPTRRCRKTTLGEWAAGPAHQPGARAEGRRRTRRPHRLRPRRRRRAASSTSAPMATAAASPSRRRPTWPGSSRPRARWRSTASR